MLLYSLPSPSKLGKLSGLFSEAIRDRQKHFQRVQSLEKQLSVDEAGGFYRVQGVVPNV